MKKYLIIALAIIGIPTYLIRSRPPGKKLAAIGWLCLFIALFAIISTLGEASVSWLG